MWLRKKKPKSFHVSSTLYNVVNNFEETDIKECTKMDKLNEKIYVSLLNKANKAEKNVKNSSIYMTIEVPPPPRPSNREKFILWTKRNVLRPVIEQTEAVLFLSSQGIHYEKDYEAYQAVDLAKQYKNQYNIKENFSDKSKNFDNVYTSSDRNIMRRRSLKRVNRLDLLDEEITDSLCQPEPNFLYGKNMNSAFEEIEENEIYDNLKPNVTHITTIQPSAPPMLYPDISTCSELHV